MYDKIYVLKPFFDHPERTYHIRELARILGLNAMTARKKLLELTQEGLLVSAEKRVAHGYHANRSHPLFREYKSFSNILSLHSSGLLTLLDSTFPRASILLLDEYRTGEDGPTSFIHLLVVGKQSEPPALEAYELKLQRRIKITFVDETSLHVRMQTDRVFAHAVAQGKTLQGTHPLAEGSP